MHHLTEKRSIWIASRDPRHHVLWGRSKMPPNGEFRRSADHVRLLEILRSSRYEARVSSELMRKLSGEVACAREYLAKRFASTVDKGLDRFHTGRSLACAYWPSTEQRVILTGPHPGDCGQPDRNA
ncbi:MAG: hypothetical protein ACREND_03345 [Gemmatimonadaceae bacterium]